MFARVYMGTGEGLGGALATREKVIAGLTFDER